MKKPLIITFTAIGLAVILLCSFTFTSGMRGTPKESGLSPVPAESGNVAEPGNITEEIEDRGFTEFLFWDIDDFKTYMATGSTNQGDYAGRTSPPASAFVPVEYIEHAYVPLNTIFDINDSTFDTLSQVSFAYNPTRPGAVRFTYYFESYSISVEYYPTEFRNIDAVRVAVTPGAIHYSQYYAERQSEFTGWNAVRNSGSMMFSRGSGKYSAAYFKEESGNVYRVDCVAGNYLISIQNNYIVPENELEAAYTHFRTSGETAYFAALFSENDTVFRAAVDKINAGLAGK